MTTVSDAKQALRESEMFYLDADPWPTGARYILVVGHKSSKLHPQTTASFIQDIVGGFVSPLLKNPKTPNVYYFTVGIEGQPKAPSISSLEDAGFAIAAVYKWSLMSQDQSLWMIKQLRGSPSGVPQFWATNAAVEPNTWIWLQVRTKKAAAIPTATVKEIVESVGEYRVTDPLSGVSGFFERTLWRDDYIGQDYTNVLFSPGAVSGVSAQKLQSEVFAESVNVELHFFSTPELNANQDKAESMAWVKDTEASGGAVIEGTGEALRAALDVVASALKAIPVLLWLALAGVAAYGGVKLYGYTAPRVRASIRRGRRPARRKP